MDIPRCVIERLRSLDYLTACDGCVLVALVASLLSKKKNRYLPPLPSIPDRSEILRSQLIQKVL